jgi:hypothetical protein
MSLTIKGSKLEMDLQVIIYPIIATMKIGWIILIVVNLLVALFATPYGVML